MRLDTYSKPQEPFGFEGLFELRQIEGVALGFEGGHEIFVGAAIAIVGITGRDFQVAFHVIGLAFDIDYGMIKNHVFVAVDRRADNLQAVQGYIRYPRLTDTIYPKLLKRAYNHVIEDREIFRVLSCFVIAQRERNYRHLRR